MSIVHAALICSWLTFLGVNADKTTVKIRLFWVRHGQSCANIMDRCAVKPPESNALLPEVEVALKSFPQQRFATAHLNKEFGVAPANAKEKDCSVEIVGASEGLTPGAIGETGAVVRVHDLYQDPALTDCSRYQSLHAGHSFIKWLKQTGTPLHFIGSSFLMRAFETACAMFVEPCSGSGAMNCSDVMHPDIKVAPLPYMTERAPRGLTAAQADNIPREVDEQSKMIEQAYGRTLPIDSSFAKTWPRYAQQFEKFKAFLATQIVPVASGKAAPPSDDFQARMEAELPEAMHHEDHGKKALSFKWSGGVYSTGPQFSKADYKELEAPEINIAVVGHNQMMMEYCQKGELPKPNNNAVLEKLFILETTPGEVPSFELQELAEKCATVMDAPDGKVSMNRLVQADVATCATPFMVSKFLGLENTGPSSDTPCVQLAAADNAYPIMPDFLPPHRSEL